MTMLSYDDVYRRPEFYWGRTPNRLCLRAADLFPTGGQGLKAVDLGCGEGRDLVHLARHGFDALGVDISAPGLQKVRQWAAAEGLTVRTAQAGLQEFRLTEPYDLVYSSGTLTYLPEPLRPEVFAHYKQFTAIGGVHAFNAFVEKPFIATAPDWGADEYHYRSGELLSLYWDWEILACEEFIFDCNSSGVPHRHAMDVLIARKVQV